MKFKSRYYDQSFEGKHEKYRYSLTGALSLLSLGIIASFFYDGERPTGYSRLGRVLYRALNGLKQMDRKEIFIAILASIIVGLISLFVFDRIFSNRPVVVGLEADESNKRIIFQVRKTTSPKTELRSYPSGSIAYRIKNLGDGLTRDKYESLVFTKKFNSLAVLYLDHEMWDNVDQEELKKEIEKIKLLTTRPIFNS